jgi:hypothetical protein
MVTWSTVAVLPRTYLAIVPVTAFVIGAEVDMVFWGSPSYLAVIE